jgi:uncharacterized membrane protein
MTHLVQSGSYDPTGIRENSYRDACMSDLFRNPRQDEEDARQMAAIQRENRLNLKALLLTLAIVIAPFLALLISLELALFALAAGLLFSTVLTWTVAGQMGPGTRSRLRTAAGMNFFVFLMVIAILGMRLIGN